MKWHRSSRVATSARKIAVRTTDVQRRRVVSLRPIHDFYIEFFKRQRTWLIMVASCFALAGCYNSAENFHVLVDRHMSVEGVVVFVDCADHGAFYYSFQAPNGEHRAKAPPRDAPCSDTHVGDKVTVFYDPQYSQTNSLLEPTAAYEKAKGWYIPEWAAFIVPPMLLVLFSIALNLKGAGRKNPPPTGDRSARGQREG